MKANGHYYAQTFNDEQRNASEFSPVYKRKCTK
jgi:hypothetical protein